MLLSLDISDDSKIILPFVKLFTAVSGSRECNVILASSFLLAKTTYILLS